MHFALLLTVATSILVGVTAPNPQARTPQGSTPQGSRTRGSAIPALRPAGQQRPGQGAQPGQGALPGQGAQQPSQGFQNTGSQQPGRGAQQQPGRGAQQQPGQGAQQQPGQGFQNTGFQQPGQGSQQQPGQGAQNNGFQQPGLGSQQQPGQGAQNTGFQQGPGQQQPSQGFQQSPGQQSGQGFQNLPVQQAGQGFQQSPVQQFPQDTTIIEATTVTVSTFDTVTHYLQVTQTRDIIVTETTGTNLIFTQEVTVRQAEPGRANTITAVVNAVQPSLVVETVETNVNTGKVATATATVFATTTQNVPCTKTITHYDRVLEQTVVPVQTVVFVDQFTTQTVTATITQEVITTIYHTASPGTNSGRGY